MTTNPYESPETAGQLHQRNTFVPKSVVQWLSLIGVLLVLFALLAPFPFGRPGVREAARRMACGNNLKNIALALQQYESIYGTLPPAYTVDADGKPLHSWRTLILPYIEQKALYDQIDLSKPWDDPANMAAHDAISKVYCCPSADLPKGKTTYLAAVAAGGCFRPSHPPSLADVTDNKSLTLQVIEVPDDHAVHWMSPQDIDEALLAKLTGPVNSSHPNGALAVFADGHTQMLRHDLKPETLRAMISFAGNDDVVAQEGY